MRSILDTGKECHSRVDEIFEDRYGALLDEFNLSAAQETLLIGMMVETRAEARKTAIAEERARCAAIARAWIHGSPTTTTEAVAQNIARAIERGETDA